MLIVILLLGFIVRVAGLNQSLWLDEAAQAIESARPLNAQLDIRGDFWPPLYHVLLHLWMIGGTSEIWLRLLSAVLGVTTIYVTYLLAAKIINARIGLVTAFLLAISPFHIWYSQEVRPYALSALLGVITIYYLQQKNFGKYVLSSVLFLYTSYLAPFLLFSSGVYIIVFEKKLFKKWFYSSVITGLFFLPWSGEFLKQLAIGKGLTAALPGWSEAVSTPLHKALPLVFTKFIFGRITFDDKLFYASVAFVLFILVSYLILLGYKTQQKVSQKLLILTLVPVISSWLVSFWLPILAPQRVLFVLPLFYILVAMGIGQQKKYQIVFISIFFLVSAYSLFLYGTNPRFQREQWREAVSYIEQNRTNSSLALFIFPDAFAPWQWYTHDLVPSLAVAPTLTVKQAELDEFTPRIVAAGKLFYFHYLTDLTDPQKMFPEYLMSLGFFETKKIDFPGVGFISIYEKTFAYN